MVKQEKEMMECLFLFDQKQESNYSLLTVNEWSDTDALTSYTYLSSLLSLMMWKDS